MSQRRVKGMTIEVDQNIELYGRRYYSLPWLAGATTLPTTLLLDDGERVVSQTPVV